MPVGDFDVADGEDECPGDDRKPSCRASECGAVKTNVPNLRIQQQIWLCMLPPLTGCLCEPEACPVTEELPCYTCNGQDGMALPCLFAVILLKSYRQMHRG